MCSRGSEIEVPIVSDMRECTKRRTLFYNPIAAFSACPSDGNDHAPGRFNFILDYGRGKTGNR